jgi:hypothetical protein
MFAVSLCIVVLLPATALIWQYDQFDDNVVVYYNLPAVAKFQTSGTGFGSA